MIIVLLHVIYFFGKFIYQNYRSKRRETMDNDTVNAEPELNITEEDRRMIDPEAPQSFEENIKFFPPAYIQRYAAVADVLNSDRYRGKIRKVFRFHIFAITLHVDFSLLLEIYLSIFRPILHMI